MGAGLTQEIRAVHDLVSGGNRRDTDEQAATCLGVSRFNDEYFCTVRRVIGTEARELRVWFEAVGDMSLGELQDPALSVLGMTRQAASGEALAEASEESRAFLPSSVDIALMDRRQHIVGSVTFVGVPPADEVFFRYGSGGYGVAGPLPVERAAALQPTPVEASTTPLCVSRYNGKYFCTVERGKVLPSGTAHLSFTVVGDMSLGQLQEPSFSKLFWTRPLGEHSAREVVATPSDVKLEENDKKYRISGTLVFQGVPLEQSVWFEYGSGGYSKVQIQLETVPSVVLTVSTATNAPCGTLVISCTSMAGAEVALVDAADLAPEQNIAELRRFLVGRLSIEEGQLTLVTQNGTLLGEEHSKRLLTEVFDASSAP